MKDLTILRLFRLFRLIRLVRLMRIFHELWVLIHGLVRALSVLVWVVFLLLILIYVGAIFVTNTVGKECDKPDYQEDFEQCFMLYGTLLRSMLTLLEVVTDGYMGVARPVLEKKPWMLLFYGSFVYLTTFGLMNIVAGVIFEQVIETSEENREKAEQENMEKHRMELQLIRSVLVAADVNGNGTLDEEEFLGICENEHVRKVFSDLGLSVSRKLLATRLFEVIDANREGNVDIDKVLERILQLKTEGKDLHKDMTLLLMDVRCTVFRIERIEDNLINLDARHSQSIRSLEERADRMDARHSERMSRIESSLEKILQQVSRGQPNSSQQDGWRLKAAGCSQRPAQKLITGAQIQQDPISPKSSSLADDVSLHDISLESDQHCCTDESLRPSIRHLQNACDQRMGA